MYRFCFHYVRCCFSINHLKKYCTLSATSCPESGSIAKFNLRCLHLLTFSSRLPLTVPLFSIRKHFSLKVGTSNALNYEQTSKTEHTAQEAGERSHISDSNEGSGEGDLFDNIDYEAIVGDDSERLKKFKLLLLEVDVLRQDGFKVPNNMTSENWKELFALRSKYGRQKLLKFLWTNEIKSINDKRKKEIKKQTALEKRAQFLEEIEKSDSIQYGFKGSTIFLRVYDSTINHSDNHRLIQAMKFGFNVVLDCGFYDDMSNMENKNCAKQLCILFGENRLHRDPFNIQFCNINRDTVLFNQLNKFIPTIDDPAFPINIREEHYTDLYPKEKLVYLTPHCRTEMTEFNPDDIYIIGALVDKQNSKPLTLAKAKSEGIRMARFPLDRYLDWGLGTKSLTINQVFSILLDLRTTGDWNTALKHVPRRKVREEGEPNIDHRQVRHRGTIFQPPRDYRSKTKIW